MSIKGKAFLFGDDINTDYIISSKYKSLILDRNKLAEHIMEDIRPGFFQEIKAGDLIVAGENFGCGSSRETAPIVLKLAGIAAVIAKSFARIYYRNSINIGLPAIICDTSELKETDTISVNFKEGYIKVENTGKIIKIATYPDQIMQIINKGGLKNYLQEQLEEGNANGSK